MAWIDPSQRQFLILFLVHPLRDPKITEICRKSMLKQTCIDNANIIEFPKELTVKDAIKLALKFRRNVGDRKLDSHELFNYAISQMINLAFSKRRNEEYFCLWCDDIEILDAQALEKARKELQIYHGVGISPYSLGNIKAFSSWFVYRAEDWEIIDWRTIQEIYNFPQTYIIFQHHHFKNKKIKTLDIKFKHHGFIKPPS
jgi:hypothetical protein